jgi:hypothetical protein
VFTSGLACCRPPHMANFRHRFRLPQLCIPETTLNGCFSTPNHRHTGIA